MFGRRSSTVTVCVVGFLLRNAFDGEQLAIALISQTRGFDGGFGIRERGFRFFDRHTTGSIINRVTGDVQSFTNRGAQTISSNRINGNLQCKSNSPAPTGGGNIVQGNKEDQCRRL